MSITKNDSLHDHLLLQKTVFRRSRKMVWVSFGSAAVFWAGFLLIYFLGQAQVIIAVEGPVEIGGGSIWKAWIFAGLGLLCTVAGIVFYCQSRHHLQLTDSGILDCSLKPNFIAWENIADVILKQNQRETKLVLRLHSASPGHDALQIDLSQLIDPKEELYQAVLLRHKRGSGLN